MVYSQKLHEWRVQSASASAGDKLTGWWLVAEEEEEMAHDKHGVRHQMVHGDAEEQFPKIERFPSFKSGLSEVE